MNNECGNKNGMYTCTLGRQHGGNHKDWVGGGYSWPTREAVVNACAAKSNSYFCTRAEGHDGNHEARGANGQTLWHAWLDSAPNPKPDEHSVLLTRAELAELYTILAGNHEIPEVYLNKVGKALKAAL